MLWYLPWSESIKKRACRYLLLRYLGNFLEEKLTLDQLSVDLYNGTGTVCDVSLDCEALNDLGDSQNWPLEIVDGHMQEITVTIPWSTLLKDDSVVVVSGLSITVQPKVRAEPVSSMLESMWSSMSSSMQLAAECLRADDAPQDAQPVEGIEMFAHAIDSILSRVKVRFVDTKIRVEHVPKNGSKGIALEIHIKNINYCDEAGTEPTPDVTDPEKPKTYIVATYTNKKIRFSGVTLYTDEFPSRLRTLARSLVMERSSSSQTDKPDVSTLEQSDINYLSTTSDVFYETRSVISTIESDPMKELYGDDRSHTDYREVTPEERANQPDPILFAKLTGEQELSLKLKHSSEVEGPKVEVRVLLGSLLVFFSPRQLHTIIELVDALNQPDLEDTSNIPLRGGVQCKPMRPADFQLIEAQLLGTLERDHLRQPAPLQGWSGPSYDESSDSEQFLPMSAAMAASACSSVSSLSSSVHVPLRQKRNKKASALDGDPTAEVSHVSLRVAALAALLVHDDVLIPTALSSDCISPQSAGEMQQIAQEFFENFEQLSAANGTSKDLDSLNDVFDRSTVKNHLRLITTEVSVDGSEKVTTEGRQTVVEASIQHALLRECLYRRTEEGLAAEGFDVLSFTCREADDASSRQSASAPRPSVKVAFKQACKYARVAGERRLMQPSTDVTVKCSPMELDIDLTLIERTQATWCRDTPPAPPAPHAPSNTHNAVNFALLCPELNAVLRFPIADLRPTAPRGQRHIRPDFFRFSFETARICSDSHARLVATCTTLDLFYHEKETTAGVHIARTGMAERAAPDERSPAASALPTISLTFAPPLPAPHPFDDDASFEPAAPHAMTTSVYIMHNLHSDQPSPFSGKKMAHQSFAKQDPGEADKEEELIVPGTEEEMANFTTDSIERAAIHLELDLPTLSLQLESKQLYEVIYNRVNSDLLLWSPRATAPPAPPALRPAFNACRQPGYDSESDSSSSEEEDNLYYSTYGGAARRAGGILPPPDNQPHNFCLTLKVGEGVLTMYPPFRDSNKLVVPGQRGQLVVVARRLALCSVSGVTPAAALCLRAAAAELHHATSQTVPADKPTLREVGAPLPPHLLRTIYPAPRGLQLRDAPDADMFAMAMKVEASSDTPNLKSITIALGIEGAALRHRGEAGAAWLTQLMDVLDVADYPVPGYEPAIVLSQLHVHLADTAVDYRPLHLPLRTVLTVGSFSFSSNIIPETSASCLRFLCQECSLFLARAAAGAGAGGGAGERSPQLARDYVCVLDVGLFELSVRLGEKVNNTPQVFVRASNNMVSVYTCVDSCNALCRLLTYLAADGDRGPPAAPDALLGFEDRPVDEIRELSPSEIQQVNDLMAEAMKESPNTTLDEDELNSSTEKEGVEIFFFPDESNLKPKPAQDSAEAADEVRPSDLEQGVDVDHFKVDDVQTEVEVGQEAKPLHAQVSKELGELTSTPKASPKKSRRKKLVSSGSGSNTDEEYCVVEAAALADRELDAPCVRWLAPDAAPPAMLDQHFAAPARRAHVLSAPAHFPSPVLKYMLSEMSVTWHIFGGQDLAPPGPPPAKTVAIDPQPRPDTHKRAKDYESFDTRGAYSSGVRWTAGAERVRPAAPPAHKDLKTRGGKHRDHDTCVVFCLSKIKFVHEVYGGEGAAAARQTLAVARLEVLDRLAASDVPRLLGPHRRAQEPPHEPAHMLVVKAVHMRPEPAQRAQECCLKVSLQPLRLHLDQDTLAFLAAFCSSLGADDEEPKSPGAGTEAAGSRQSTPTHRPPVMSVAPQLRQPAGAMGAEGAGTAPLLEAGEASRLVSENLIQLEEDFHRLRPPPPPQPPAPRHAPDDEPIYFRRVVFSPEVPIRLDYVGKRVDLSAGPVAGLLLGLASLNCCELTLRRLDCRAGLLGGARLLQWVLAAWLGDIKRRQLPGLIGHLGPMHSLLQLLQGVAELVWLPLAQWRRDGRLVYGLRRGAASFSARAATAALDLTQRLLRLVQACAETAFDMVSPAPAGALAAAPRRRRRPAPPADLRAAVHAAAATLSEGVARQRAAVSARGDGRGVLRACAAPLALAAAGAASAATVLAGVQAHLDQDNV